MASLLLAVIYVSFISLGLPDSMLGAAWPSMYGALNVPLSWAGIISMIIAGSTIASSLLSDRLTRSFGAGRVTAVSVCMTAAALLGFSFSRHFIALCLLAVPYGFGAGGVDAALNNYVALHYKSRHLSWLHCFWGVGAAVGPYIMGLCLTGGLGWSSGYRVIGVFQTVLAAFLFLSLPIWKGRSGGAGKDEKDTGKALRLRDTLRLKGALLTMVAFICYCALESTAGLWVGSYMALHRGVDAETSAKWAALFFVGISTGRFASGFVADRFGDKKMIRLGQLTLLSGIILLLLPINTAVFAGLVVLGFGCAPIYPCIIHQTPVTFGVENSQAVIGVQMASAYIGSTFFPPLFGLIVGRERIALLPPYLLVFALLMIFMIERFNKTVRS